MSCVAAHAFPHQRESRPPGRVPAFMSPGRAAPALLLYFTPGHAPTAGSEAGRGVARVDGVAGVGG
jgi:hypothetical protein